LAATPKPLEPGTLNLHQKEMQATDIPVHAKIVHVAAHVPHERRVLLLNRPMPIGVVQTFVIPLLFLGLTAKND
jgi:hypothetical protein